MKTGTDLLILGAGGMLGTALVRIAEECGCHASPLVESDLDITDRSLVREAIARHARQTVARGLPGAVINAAAYTDVERAEDDADRAFLVNDTAAGYLASEAHAADLPFAHVSTDFVFDGSGEVAYQEDDRPNPVNVYGASKLAGERSVLLGHPGALVVRTAWTYGCAGTNFPLKILQRARDAVAAPGEVRVLQVVADEIGSPTYSVDLARGLLALLAAGAGGLYHLTGQGCCTRYELALEVLQLAGISVPADVRVEPVVSGSFPTRASRPLRAVLNCDKAARLGVRLPEWRDGLARYLTGR
jgi:dTDP-4-dehydrorhamnose reductase